MKILALSATPDLGVVQVLFEDVGQPTRTTLVPGSDTTDWPQEVQAFCAKTWTPEKVKAFQEHHRVSGPKTPNRQNLYEDAVARIDWEHSRFLRELTGNATTEERDTWKTKEEAARAYITGNATDGQTAMIELEAQGDGTDPAVLAQLIVAKAERFQNLIGIAAGLKSKAKAAIKQATDETASIEQIGPALEGLLGQVRAEAEAAAEAWKAQTSE